MGSIFFRMCVLFDANVEICGVKRIFLCLCLHILVVITANAQLQALCLPASATCRVLPRFSEMEMDMLRAGLVNVKAYLPDAILDIRYATDSNFVGVNVYGAYNKCYLQKDVAIKLQKADSILKRFYPGWKMVLYDCARPVSAQQILWDSLDVPIEEKGKYLSNPQNKSVHNFGAAVDLNLADVNGRYLDMGTDFDYFGQEAYPFMEKHYFHTGLFSQKQMENRRLLRQIMTLAGFRGVPHEWWHFNSCSREEARGNYTIVE